MPRVPIVRRLVVAVIVIGACGGAAPAATTADPRVGAATEYAVTADRALAGTRFDDLVAGDLAAVIVGLCSGRGVPAEVVVGAIAALDLPSGPPGDDAIFSEVVLTGMATVCPERFESGGTTAYLVAVAAAVAAAEGEPIDDSAFLAAGLAACDALDAGDPGDALVAVAAIGFGTEATLDEILAGALRDRESVTAGAILTAAAAHLCPQHRERVAEFIGGLAA